MSFWAFAFMVIGVGRATKWLSVLMDKLEGRT